MDLKPVVDPSDYFGTRTKPCQQCGSMTLVPTAAHGVRAASSTFCDDLCRRNWERENFHRHMDAMPEAPFGMFSIVPLLKMKQFASPAEAEPYVGKNVWHMLRRQTFLKWLQADRAAIRCGLHPGLVWGEKWWNEAGVCPKCGEELEAERCKPCGAKRQRAYVERISA